MECCEKIKRIVGTVIGYIAMGLLILTGIAMFLINSNIQKEIIIPFDVINVIFFISAIVGCVTIIPITFGVLEKKEKKRYYFCNYLILFFMPLGLVGGFIHLKNICFIIVIIIASLAVACFIYKKLSELKEIDIQYLKHLNSSAIAITTILFSLGKLFFKEKLEIIHLLFFSFPLLMLTVVYEKLEMKIEEPLAIPDREPPKMIDAKVEKSIEGDKQGNTTVSGTISINLEIKI